MDAMYGWLVFIFILIIILIIVWALMRNRLNISDYSTHVEDHIEADTPEYIPEVFEPLVLPGANSSVQADQPIDATSK